MKTPWLRIAVPYSGQGKGFYFIPEIGEEVMVGFEMNNAERPYIIGTFFNGGNGNLTRNGHRQMNPQTILKLLEAVMVILYCLMIRERLAY